MNEELLKETERRLKINSFELEILEENFKPIKQRMEQLKINISHDKEVIEVLKWINPQ